MGYDKLKNDTEGFEGPGSIIPFVDPYAVFIVGLDVEESEHNWFAHCPRLADETDEDLEDYVQEILSGKAKALDPVDVYRDGSKLGVLDGRRTTRAARLARAQQVKQGVEASKLVAIRTIIHRGTPEELHRINTDSHKHKPLSPMQIAKQVLHYYEHVKQDVAKTAARFKITPQHIRANILPLFDLDASLQKAVDEGKLAVNVAVDLKDKPRDEQRQALAQLEEVGATKGIAAKNAIAAIKRGEKVTAKDKTRPRTAKQLGKWRSALAKIAEDKPAYSRMVEMIDFVLGKAPSEWMLQQFRVTLTEAGLIKEPKAPKEPKAKKEPKPKKEPKAKKPAAAKAKKGKK